ncbi:MAG: hypothetical protein H7138_08260 [Myxococcales bacterium]|nr:hypothetical protein [Myxococcales bacterium]
MELQDSARPTPSAKLAQARRDIAADPRRYECSNHRVPVAITHQLGFTQIQATMDIADVLDVLGALPSGAQMEAGEVTMSLDTLLRFVERGVTTDVLRTLRAATPLGERDESEAV